MFEVVDIMGRWLASPLWATNKMACAGRHIDGLQMLVWGLNTLGQAGNIISGCHSVEISGAAVSVQRSYSNALMLSLV